MRNLNYQLKQLCERNRDGSYLKRIGPVTAIQQSRTSITDDEAIRQLVAMLKKVHDPLAWRIDVSKRIKAIQLGQW